MGSSTKIQDTNLAITKFTCSQCQQSFTNHDKETDNGELWGDTSGEPSTEANPNYKGFDLSIWVRSIEHQECPEEESHE